MSRIATVGLLALLASASARVPAAPGDPEGGPAAPARLADARQRRARLGLDEEYRGVSGVRALKVAVLDYGFAGAGLGRGYLPANAAVVEHYDLAFVARHPDLGDPGYRKPFEPGNGHGRAMAQIVWAVTGSYPGGPQFYLLNANGPTMLRRAVRYSVEQDVDIILFSGSFEGGGNGDGRGFLNRVVGEAHAAGIIWINAAGNFGGKVHNAPVQILESGHLRLVGGPDAAALRFRNRLDENTVTVTLTWNDYREEEDAGTTKDLDLSIEDWAGRRVGAGELVQVAGDRVAGPGESRNPRERVVLPDLPASPPGPDGAYRIRVRAKAGTFGEGDRIRVLVTAEREFYVRPGSREPVEAVEFLDASREGELFPPADHPLALTVGAADPTSSVGPTEDRRVKPDVILADAEALFSDGTLMAGSSVAAAYFAGVVAVLKSAEPGLATRHLLDLARRGGGRSRPPVAAATRQPSGARLTRLAIPASTSQVGTDSGDPARLAPAAESVPPAGLPPYLERRLWTTPTRAELAEAVRGASPIGPRARDRR